MPYVDLFWTLVQEIEEAIRFKLGRFADEDDWDLQDTNDFLEIIRELKRQIFLVFREVGIHFSTTLIIFVKLYYL